MIPKIQDLTAAEFCTWLKEEIVDELIFTSREQLIALLAAGCPHEKLEREFREFYNGYFNLAFSLEDHEDYVLSVLRSEEEFRHLRHRVAHVESVRKTSAAGRITRRMIGPLITDPQPEIKVMELSNDDFHNLIGTLVNSELFASRERLVKLLNTKQSDKVPVQLRAEFWEFLVCYLELEQFLEDYDYDPDEGLELRPEFIEELNRVDDQIKNGGKMVSLEEAAKEFGIKL